MLWDETATELTKTNAKSLLDSLEAEDEDDAPALPAALTNTYGSVHVFEIKSHTYFNHVEYESFTCTGVFPVDHTTESDLATESSNSKRKGTLKVKIKGPQLNTPSKPAESKKDTRYNFNFQTTISRLTLIFGRINPYFFFII